MSIKLRKIKISDLRYFLKWWKDKELIKPTSGYYEKSDKILTSYFLNFISNTKDHHYMIMADSRTIGHIALTRKDKNSFEIHIVISDKHYWSQGLGTRAIKKALNIAFKKLGYKKAYLEVRPDNLRAIRAYEKCGFAKRRLKKYPNNKYHPAVVIMTLTR